MRTLPESAGSPISQMPQKQKAGYFQDTNPPKKNKNSVSKKERIYKHHQNTVFFKKK